MPSQPAHLQFFPVQLNLRFGAYRTQQRAAGHEVIESDCRCVRLEAELSAAWATVIAVGAGTVVLKAVGPVGVSGRKLPPRVAELLDMVAPAILAALVVTETFASGRTHLMQGAVHLVLFLAYVLLIFQQ